MKSLYVFSLLLCSLWNMAPHLIFAQHIQYIITGHVKDVQGNAIPAATLTLISKPDTTITLSCVSNEEGSYTFPIDVDGFYSIKVTAMGFVSAMQTVEVPRFLLIPDFKLMADTNALSEVVVTSRKPLVEYKPDRTVFNVENSITATGGNAWEALKKTPGVIIQGNQVTISGGGSVSVMINGRMQQLSGDDLAQFLQNIAADNLSKIEVITTPQAKYDAEGGGGIINIITKKSLKSGLNGNVSLSYNRNTFNSPTASSSVNYRRDKLSVFSTGSIGVYAWKNTGRVTTYFPNQRREQAMIENWENKYARLQLGMEYSLTKKSVIGIQLSEAVNKNDCIENIRSSNINNMDITDSVNLTTGATHDFFPGKHSINLNYDWRIDSLGKRLQINTDYYSQQTDKQRNFDVSNQLPNEQIVDRSINRTILNPSIDIRSVKADFEWPTKIAIFTIGAKASMVKNSADNNFFTQTGNVYVADLTKTNSFDYQENIQALYATIQKGIGKFEFQAGLRTEHTFTKTYSSTMSQSNNMSYTNFFPSGYLHYSTGFDHSFSFNFSRRINRPRYGLLNPFRYYYTPSSYSEGNPNLQPEFNTIFDLTYVFKSSYRMKIFARRATNCWDRNTRVDSITGISNTSTANIGDAGIFGINLNATLNPAEWWECDIALNGAYSRFEPYYYPSTRYASLLGSFEYNSTFYLNNKKTFSAELNGYYNSPRQRDLRQWEEMYCINIGFRLMLLDKNLILTVNGDDLTGTASWRLRNLANGTQEYYYDDERSVRFSVTYKFGKKNMKRGNNQNTTEEIQRIGQ